MKASKTALADLRRLREAAAAEAGPGRAEKPHHARAAASTSPAPPLTGTRDTAPSGSLLAPADRALFRQAMRFVRPIVRHGNRVLAPGPIPEALLRARREQAQGPDVLPAAAPRSRTRRHPRGSADPDAEEFLQPGCGTDLLRGLRRGRWLPQAILDLHGSTEDEAHDRLDRFIDSCAENEVRCVRIVHGKGRGSRHGTPVLKSAVRIHLCRLPAVQAWVQCAEADGGAGAVTALLHVRGRSAGH